LLFLVEGLPPILLGLLAVNLLPRGGDDIQFLSAEERDWLRRELRADVLVPEYSAVQGLKSALRNPRVWNLGYLLFTTTFIVNVMLIWMPQIIRQMSHQSNTGVGLLNSLPWVSLGIGIVLMSKLSDKVANRVSVLSPSLAVSALGFLLAAALQNTNPSLAFVGLLVAAFGGGAAQGAFWAITMDLINGPSAAAAYAIITVLGNGSGVFAHPLIGKLHDVTGSFGAVAWALAAFNVVAIAVAYRMARRSPASRSPSTPKTVSP